MNGYKKILKDDRKIKNIREDEGHKRKKKVFKRKMKDERDRKDLREKRKDIKKEERI